MCAVLMEQEDCLTAWYRNEMLGLMCRSPILSENCIRRDLNDDYLHFIFSFSRIALFDGCTWPKVYNVSYSVMLLLQRLGCKGVSYKLWSLLYCRHTR